MKTRYHTHRSIISGFVGSASPPSFPNTFPRAAFHSPNFATNAISLDVKVNRGVIPYSTAVSFSLGIRSKASRVVERTLVLIDTSSGSPPSSGSDTSSKFNFATPAFASKTSSLSSSFIARAAKSFTLWYRERSSGQTSTIVLSREDGGRL